MEFNFYFRFYFEIYTVLRTRIMSAMCYDHDFRDISVWALVKRYIWMQVQNYQMGTFLAIGEWYEAREKTLAHVDSEVGFYASTIHLSLIYIFFEF